MSTAYNHMKRSHRSQKIHYSANQARFVKCVTKQERKNGGFLSRLAKTFRGRTSEA